MDNFERIKSMDRDELAKFLFHFRRNKYKWYGSCVFCFEDDEYCVYSCMKCWLGKESKEHGGIDEEESSDENIDNKIS